MCVYVLTTLLSYSSSIGIDHALSTVPTVFPSCGNIIVPPGVTPLGFTLSSRSTKSHTIFSFNKRRFRIGKRGNDVIVPPSG